MSFRGLKTIETLIYLTSPLFYVYIVLGVFVCFFKYTGLYDLFYYLVYRSELINHKFVIYNIYSDNPVKIKKRSFIKDKIYKAIRNNYDKYINNG